MSRLVAVMGVIVLIIAAAIVLKPLMPPLIALIFLVCLLQVANRDG